MALSQEQIETLEAFVDGALDPAAQAGVEKLMAANPQLRKLLGEMIADRDVLRGLPRAKAPADLVETFNGQLERAELFGDAGPHATDAHRISRWPQYMSVAAVVMLAVGLAAIVYKVMIPHGKPSNVYVAADGGLSDGSRDLGVRRAAPVMTTQPVDETLSSTPLASDLHAKVSAAPSTMAVAAAAAPPPGDERPLASSDELRAMQRRMIGATQPADEPIVMVVRAEHPESVNVQVRAYLTANAIEFQEAPEAASLALDRARDQQGGQENVALSKAAGVARPAGPRPGTSQRADDRGMQQGVGQNANAAKAEQTPVAAEPTSVPSYTRNGADEAGAPRSQAVNSASANQAPAPSRAQPVDPLAVLNNATTASASGGGIMYRAMMTQSQLRELNVKLGAQLNQWTELHGSIVGDLNEARAVATVAGGAGGGRAASTQPVAPAFVDATQPTRSTAKDDALAATRPATQPSDPPREVVIVVPAGPIEIPATSQPTTGPTTAPATTAPQDR